MYFKIQFVKPFVTSLVLFFVTTAVYSQNPQPNDNPPNSWLNLSKFQVGSFFNKPSKDIVFVRPFITDDARVVGNGLVQLETWVRFDNESGQHWILGAYGPNEALELTVGGVSGYEVEGPNQTAFSYALPLLQLKYLFNEYKPNKLPGFALVLGTFLPVGQNSFKPAGYGSFGFMTISQSVGENDDYLFHLNIGGNYLHIDGTNSFIKTWGVGTQLNVYGGMYFVGELFSGDPYIPGTGTSYQIGYRYFFSDFFQVDMTIGNGIAGEVILPFWFSAGVRIVTERFFQ